MPPEIVRDGGGKRDQAAGQRECQEEQELIPCRDGQCTREQSCMGARGTGSGGSRLGHGMNVVLLRAYHNPFLENLL